MDTALEYDNDYYIDYTYTLFPNGSRNPDIGDIYSHNTSGYGRENNSDGILKIIGISKLITCLLGVVGNGIVIWLLGFRVQRNPFMTFILNLAIADLGFLVSATLFSVPFKIHPPFLFLVSRAFVLISFYSASQFLLTVISIDRCVAVFFPLWHRCHRPPRLSTIVCALMWVLSSLLTAVTYILMIFNPNRESIVLSIQLIVNVVLCLPLVTISTVALFIKVCFKPRQHRRGKILTILLLTLSFFLLFAFPLNAMLILHVYVCLHGYLKTYAMLLACLNSSVNPAIYFLVGRQRKTRRRESLKMILQRAFKEEEGSTEEAPAETQL